MTIQEITATLIHNEPAIAFPLRIDRALPSWIKDALGRHVLDVRGWGRFQYADDNKGAELQDAFAAWVVEALNAQYAQRDIITAFEDRPHVADMIEGLGITCVRV